MRVEATRGSAVTLEVSASASEVIKISFLIVQSKPAMHTRRVCVCFTGKRNHRFGKSVSYVYYQWAEKSKSFCWSDFWWPFDIFSHMDAALSVGSLSTPWYSTLGTHICWIHSGKPSFFTRSPLGLFTDPYVSHSVLFVHVDLLQCCLFDRSK